MNFVQDFLSSGYAADLAVALIHTLWLGVIIALALFAS